MFKAIFKISQRRPSLSWSPLLRTLYTDRSLGLCTVLAAQEENLAKLKSKQNVENLRKRILESGDRGLLLSSDMECVSYMVGSVCDLSLYKSIIKRFIELNHDSKIALVTAVNHVNMFCKLAHLTDAPDMAKELLEDNSVKEVIPVSRSVACYSYLLLMNLLFKSKKFDEVLKVYEEMDISRFEKSHDMLAILTLTMLAVIKVNKSGSFDNANGLLETYMDENRGEELLKGRGMRLAFAYAWLACKDMKFTTAYEIIHADYTNDKQSLKINLKLYTLLKLEKVNDALNALEDFIDNCGGPERLDFQKPKFSLEVIQLLMKAANESKDEELNSTLKTIFAKLDYLAEVTNETIENLLFLPMDSAGYTNQKKRARAHEMETRKYRYKPQSESQHM